jgi:hypothetical protein
MRLVCGGVQDQLTRVRGLAVNLKTAATGRLPPVIPYAAAGVSLPRATHPTPYKQPLITGLLLQKKLK